ncbi:MAG: PilZ domain-containing protein [Pseudomonadota bacterium]
MRSRSTKTALERRRTERVPTGYNVSFRMPEFQNLAELIDISATGCRIRVRNGLAPYDHGLIRISTMDQSQIDGKVIWVSGQDCGVIFSQLIPDVFDFVHFDHLGEEFYWRIAEMQQHRA